MRKRLVKIYCTEKWLSIHRMSIDDLEVDIYGYLTRRYSNPKEEMYITFENV